MEERRRSPRLELPLALAYYPKDNALQFNYTISKNISRGGLCIPAVSGIAKEGDIIKMEIEIDGKYCVTATGKVKWAKKFCHKTGSRKKTISEFANDQEAGIEFIDTPSADIDRVINSERLSRKSVFFKPL